MPGFHKYVISLRKALSLAKRHLITLGGLRRVFRLEIMGSILKVDYNLRPSKVDRDYGIIVQLAKAKSIQDFISGYNYCMVYLRTGKVIEDVVDLADRGRCHVLLMPKESHTNEAIRALDLRGL